MVGRREAVSKFAAESGSRRSMFMVRQLAVAMICDLGKCIEGVSGVDGDFN